MSARKWPVRSMIIGSSFVVEQPTKALKSNLYNRAHEYGMRLSIKKAKRSQTDPAWVVTRVA